MPTHYDGYDGDPFEDGLQTCTDITSFFTDTYVKPWIYGNISAGVLYGAIVVIVIAYFHILVIRVKRENPLSKQQWILSIYVAGTFVLSTLQIAGALQNTTKGLHKFGCTNTDFTTVSGGKSWLENVCFMLTAWTVDMIMVLNSFLWNHDYITTLNTLNRCGASSSLIMT
ncbi:hypothetical protein BDQ17DRAFT_1430204 [Cyathus striatus]|nr:hypothetical protein BDQ17DRAFT_1430204 [Cyathus striatus]